MKWNTKDEKELLRRSFLFGLSGISVSLLALVNVTLGLVALPMGVFFGVGTFLQLFGLSIAVMTMRKRKVSAESQEKAKQMILVLGVSLLFFILVM
ncbi:hypothetical protein A3SI_14154 [Nitritalea halalkaliphila LW7]|uniref:Uncharacterized protein n=1 Tax=Nitritalea halalkaliphila LW7 TaxID=1189621 RepID=I5BZW8_9BACT|nr:hypothetical protein [Nitritalea halalkaliphila]EIM75120.1 hypothetical protein A3SI_14154 [Nitritalea halalkaliphila LW7]